VSVFSAPPFSDDWVAELVEASAGREPIGGLSGVVALGVGSKVDAANAEVTVAIDDGRLTGRSDETPEVVVGLSKKQLAAWRNGELLLAEAYMQGDLKPVGASGPLFAALELLDWATSAGADAAGDN
jgi:hypothetical protein